MTKRKYIDYEPGTLVAQTSKFRKSIGSVTRGPKDGIVLGSRGDRVLVAWSDGYAGQIHKENIRPTKRQLPLGQVSSLVAAEIRLLPETMAHTYDAEEVEAIKGEYGIVDTGGTYLNPGEYVDLTSEARYWIRTPESKWYSVTQSEATRVYGTPKGDYGKAKTRNVEREVAVLSVMPYSYTSKSDVERGLGVVLWDWGIGPMTCDRVEASIDDMLREEAGRAEPSRFVRAYLALKDMLCGGRENNPKTTKKLKAKLLR